MKPSRSASRNLDRERERPQIVRTKAMNEKARGKANGARRELADAWVLQGAAIQAAGVFGRFQLNLKRPGVGDFNPKTKAVAALCPANDLGTQR